MSISTIRQGRDPRAARRKRRRQVDAGQDAVRFARTQFRRDLLERRAGAHRQPGRARKLGIGMVFQHFSLFEALTAAENIALSLDDKTPISTIAAKAQGALLQLRPAARSLLAGRRPLGRRTPAHRDHPLPAADAAADHPRRADLGADAAGGRQAVRDAGAAAQRGQVDPLHLAPAGRGEAHVRRAPPCCATARWSATAIRARKPPRRWPA